VRPGAELKMLSHTTLGVSDMRAARRFYDPLLAALGLTLKFADENWAGWKQREIERPLFIITRPFDGAPASTGNGQMIALLAATRSLVDACHRLALGHGGTDEGRPGLRPEYHANYYGAYFRDPDGNKLCVCCHDGD
jgi:catechol 2,3-dioxygenase-like lactoylglutathione lyase family enzyme